MSDLTLSLASLIIGVLATVWVSRYYFLRAVDKKLTAYVQFSSSLFDGVDSSVREALKISYKGTAVSDLLDIQFLVANTGERAIRDVICPLSVSIPKDCILLDASVLHVSPEGREVTITQAAKAVSFLFPLLNTGEFFVTKLLLQGRARPKDFLFSITVDDLPPTLSPVPLPHDLIDTGKKRGFEGELLVLGAILLLLGASFAGVIFGHSTTLQECWTRGVVTSFPQHWILLLSVLVTAIPAILLLVIGPMVMVGAFTNFSFPKRKRFRVPEDIVRRRIFFEDFPLLEHPQNEKKEG